MHGGCRSLRTSNSGQWWKEADRVKSIRLPALSPQHSALTTGGCVRQWTDARKRSSKLPVLPLFGTSGAATRCRGSIRKSFPAKPIGPAMGVAGRSGFLVGIGAPNLPHRFPRHVHYLRLKSRTQMTLPRSRQSDVRRSRPKCGNGNILEDGPCLTGGRGRFYDEATFFLDEFSQGDSSCPGEPGEAC